MFWDPIVESLRGFLSTTLIGLLSVGAVFITVQIKRLKDRVLESIEQKDKTGLLESVTHRLFALTETVVLALEANAGKLIREAVAEGKITKEEGREQLQELGKQALQEIKNLLGAELLDQLQEQKIDVDAWIQSLIDSYVEKMKDSLYSGSENGA
jgi:polyhydroxyalkanoate synthesis regulator phasin